MIFFLLESKKIDLSDKSRNGEDSKKQRETVIALARYQMMFLATVSINLNVQMMFLVTVSINLNVQMMFLVTVSINLNVLKY